MSTDNVARGLAVQAASAFPYPMRGPNTCVLFGDSITANNWSGSPLNLFDKGYFNWAQFFSGNRFTVLNNAGIAGNTTTQMVTRIQSDVLAYRPAVVIFMGGTNDPRLAAETIPNYRTIFAALRKANVYVIHLGILPRPNASMAQKYAIPEINRWAAWYWETNGGGEFVDAFGSIVDPTNSGQGVLNTALLDYVHPSAAGAQMIGAALSPVLQKWPARRVKVTNVLDAAFNTGGVSSVMTNALCSGTTGTVDSPLTGSLPNYWRLSPSGSAGGSASIVAAPDGYGYAIQIDATGAANGDTVYLTQQNSIFDATGAYPAKLHVGDQYRFVAQWKIENLSNVVNISSYANSPGNRASEVAVFSSSSSVQYLTTTMQGEVISPIGIIQSGTTTFTWFAAKITFTGTGACRLTIWNPVLERFNRD